MSSLILLCLFSHFWFVLLPHYEAVPLQASVGYVQTISNDVAQASPRLVPPVISHVYHRSGHDLFLCCHKSNTRRDRTPYTMLQKIYYIVYMSGIRGLQKVHRTFLQSGFDITCQLIKFKLKIQLLPRETKRTSLGCELA
jgi:hypothetical protein